MKKFLRILVFLCAFGIVGNNGFAAVEKENVPADEKEYLNILGLFVSMTTELEDNKILERVILEFIRNYPDSEFAAEAKLRLAEFYKLNGLKSRAKKWLDDIIENHPIDDYYTISHEAWICGSVIAVEYFGQKTAAWALYWRAVWFSKNRLDDLKKILTDYKESKKVVRLIKGLLDRMIEKERREK